jgi:hypothetical protein
MSRMSEKAREAEKTATTTPAPVARTSSNLPAIPDQESDNVYKAAVAGHPPTMKFKKGEYFVGDAEIPLGKVFLAYAADWRRGWRLWQEKGVVDDRVVRVADNPAEPVERDELSFTNQADWPIVDGERMDPWSLENQLPVEDVETGERFLFVTTSFGGKLAIEKVCGRWATNVRKGLDKGLPIVKLGVGHFTTKKWGKIARPDLEIVGWERDDGGPIDVTPPPDGGKSFNDEIPFTIMVATPFIAALIGSGVVV